MDGKEEEEEEEQEDMDVRRRMTTIWVRRRRRRRRRRERKMKATRRWEEAPPHPLPCGHSSDSQIKGLTLLWMCLCCLSPEDVAKVLPHSGQVWARAPTCCERMCRCRLLGSVNTYVCVCVCVCVCART